MMAEDKALKRKLEALEFSLGKDIIKYMQADSVSEVIVNPDCSLWITTFDRGDVDTGIKMDPISTDRIIKSVAALTQQVVDAKRPEIEAEIPDSYLFDKSRFEGLLPNIVESPCFNIRKHPKVVLSLDDYVKQGVMSIPQKEIICQAVKEKKNIIAAGGTGSGKTTLLNAILAEISKYPDRVVLLEDTPELRCTTKNLCSLRTMPEVSMANLLYYTLRLSPKRIVVGEVRSGEALDLMDAWSTGHSGGCSTVHSNNAHDTLLRLENMTSRVAKSPQQITISKAVDIIIYLKYENMHRKIEEIISVDGYDVEKRDYITHRIE